MFRKGGKSRRASKNVLATEPSTRERNNALGTGVSIRKKLMNRLKSTRKPRRAAQNITTEPKKEPQDQLKRKPGAVTVAEIDAGLPDSDGYETLDKRAIDAARYLKNVIFSLVFGPRVCYSYY